MSAESRKLQPGAMVQTDFSGKWTTHKITERRDGLGSQSGVQFRVAPVIPKSTGGWCDADWFWPAKTPADPDDEIDGDAAILVENGL